MRLPDYLTIPLLSLLISVFVASTARADSTEEARVYLDKATAAYALHHYAAAAENFEKAFELKPDPALLYNAAQSSRLAGNKERALELYEGYLRVYGSKTKDKRAEIEDRIKQLKQAIEHDKAIANSPPTGTEPVNVAGADGGRAARPRVEPLPPATAPPAPPAAPPRAETMPPPAAVAPISAAPTTAAAPAPDVTHAPAPPPSGPASVTLEQKAAPPSDEGSVFQKTWFWVAVGGGVVAATVAVVLLAGGSQNPAMASLGRANGN